MGHSDIHLIDATTNRVIAAAPQSAVLAASGDWNGLIVEHQLLGAAEMPPHTVIGHRLLVNLGLPLRFEWKGAHWNQAVYPTGSFALQSDGDFNAPRWHQPLECLAIALAPPYISALVGGDFVEFEEIRGQSDAVISELALRFKVLVENQVAGNTLFAEHLKTAFAFHLLQNYSTERAKLSALRGRLEGRFLKSAVEFAHDNLAQPLSLEQMATQAHLSPFHFARQFKATTGVSPHQFLMQLRIERAQELLASGHTSTQAAFATGFYDQSHFVRVFKRATGVTPKSFAR